MKYIRGSHRSHVSASRWYKSAARRDIMDKLSEAARKNDEALKFTLTKRTLLDLVTDAIYELNLGACPYCERAISPDDYLTIDDVTEWLNNKLADLAAINKVRQSK